jgi:TPR repeat protein
LCQAVIPARLLDNGFFSVFCLLFFLSNSFVVEAAYKDDIILGVKQGDAQAQYAQALLYEYGSEEVSRDQKKSLQFFQQAAEKNVAGACLYLGLKYEHGNGVVQDYKKAICYYLCAARQDWPMAQFFLADFYVQGKGVKKSALTALAWLGLAREHGYPRAEAEFLQLKKQLGMSDLTVITTMQGKLMKKITETCN